MREMSLKKVFAAVLAVLMVVGMAPSLSFAAEGDKVKISVKPSTVRIPAGEAASLEVWVENTSSENLEDVEVMLTGEFDPKFLWAAGSGVDTMQPSKVIEGTIAPGDSKKAVFTLEAKDGQASAQKKISAMAYLGDTEIGRKDGIEVNIQESANGVTPPEEETVTAKNYPVRIDNGSKAPNLIKGLYFRSVTLNFEFADFAFSQYDRITATVGQPSDGGIELENMEYEEILIDDGTRESRSMKVRVRALAGAAPGFYTLPITITAECAEGLTAPDGSSTLTYQLRSFVKVNESEGDEQAATEFYISKYQVDKENIQYGDQFDFSIDLVNTGSDDLSNVKMRISGLATDGLTLVDDTDVKYIDVKSGATETVTYRLEASEKIGTGRYPVTVEATYTPKSTGTAAEGGAAEARTETVTAYIKVTGKPTEEDEPQTKQEKPVIIIDSYTYGGENVTFGSEFPLTMILRNTSTSATIRNLKVTLSDDSGVFSPTKSSNTFFVQSIAPGATVEQTVEFLASYPVTSESNAKSYTINVSYEYEAMAGGKLMDNAFTSNEVLSIPLMHTDRFSVGELYVDSQAYVGQQSFVNLSFINEGKSTVYNLSVRMEGENMTISEGNYYVGNLQSGTQDSFEAYFTPQEAGQAKGTIIFTYEDANNAPKEIRKEFTVEAMGFDDPGMMGGMDPGMDGDLPAMGDDMMVDGEKPGLGKGVIVAIVAGSLAVLGAGAFITVRVVKKRRRIAEDEDI